MGVQQDAVVGSNLIGEEPASSQSDACSIGIQQWNRAEKAAEGIISNFQPSIVAEKKRDAVIIYLQKLLKDKLDCEMSLVFAYGSVPLKTYLPDGDIDLSVVGARTRSLIKEIASLLESEEKNSSAEFVVKDVQLIGAQVKLVKCLVQNLVVDISVNQIGGLCTLCFLEQVDRVIKKDHLFKRSIILIKAWCYYESRTLGAHVGLISTYGLETLVLYIFHVFHITIDGPLSVLYKFLEYFSTFDWDNYGISLMGPIRLSELPRIMVERPPNSDDLLLKVGFLRRCSDTLSIPMRHGDTFSKKHLNIVDPLNVHNNLGRSVSQGNFFRIRSALGYGARKLRQILTAPEDKLTEELLSFFSNTLKMHGSGQASSLTISVSGAEKSFTTRVSGKPRSSNDENEYLGSGNQISSDEKDVSTLKLSGAGEVAGRVCIPFYAPHLFSEYSKLANKTEDGDHDVNDVKQSEVHDEDVLPSEPLDLTGDLLSHLICLDHVRGWDNYLLAPPGVMGPPPPPPLVLLSMIASEHGGINGFHHPQFHPTGQMFMSRPPFIPNDPNQAAPVNHYLDMNRSGHGYHTSSTSGNRAPNSNNSTPRPEGVNGPMQQREPLLHRRRQQNLNRPRQLDGSQRPRSASGTDRLALQSSYHLKDEGDFPPLSG
ncbi:putative polynucleotide adenylyltransferase [Helianthus annuus]|uniref:Polynucleotide adenylyltransferase n=1 Tax=Helianthus annuus TaxID=4232 RepID=A0A9K3DSI6_HELAN|nr:putative polynucleotide adenylyltransferase [Helianthus annuus]KAJ0442342.1 putative polynucleotide adenylyltransferase [Helianthus annuus]KAJ0820835.1 putative polynucleotide adenylyltransferase [Helianthus annuus]KAJ0835441.1 putative polynucleotide adenylyltransferase [Helianthus annuus]